MVADRYYPSSKTCITCGHIKKNLRLSERICHCEVCGNEMDRDLQAAINLSMLNATISAPVRCHSLVDRQCRLTNINLAVNLVGDFVNHAVSHNIKPPFLTARRERVIICNGKGSAPRWIDCFIATQ